MKRLRTVYAVALALASIAPMAAQEAEYNPHKINFNGYLRSGLGHSSGGSKMVNFKAPSILHKFRLGNEADLIRTRLTSTATYARGSDAARVGVRWSTSKLQASCTSFA